jgi:hypothetical protein
VSAPALFDHVAKLIEYFMPVEQFAAFGLSGTAFQFRLQLREGFLALSLVAFEQTKGFAHYFACRLVAPGLDAALEEGIEFGGKRDWQFVLLGEVQNM